MNTPEIAQHEDKESFTDRELDELEELIWKLVDPETPPDEKKPTWNDLTKSERALLERRYGPVRHTSRKINVSGYTSGEACADNERAMPFGSGDKNYGVWDRNFIVYALYDSKPNINLGGKIRMVPASLTVDMYGNVLFPDYYYTPTSKPRRESMVSQINRDPRGDRSIHLGDEFVGGALDSDNIEVTVYRQIGSRGSLGGIFDDAALGRAGMKKLNVYPMGEEDKHERARKYIQIAKYVQEGIAEIVEDSNFSLFREKFADPTQTLQFKPKANAVLLPAKSVDGQRDVLFGYGTKKIPAEGWQAIEDPTWRYESTGPLVIREEVDGKDNYYYVNREDGVVSAPVAKQYNAMHAAPQRL